MVLHKTLTIKDRFLGQNASMWILTLTLTFVLHLASVSSAEAALQCQHLFKKKHIVEVPYEHVFSGQTMVGRSYALYKALRDAGLNPLLKITHLTEKQRKILEASILEDLQTPIPAVRDPQGRIFLLDGHHTLLMAKMLQLKDKDAPIILDLVYDAIATAINWKTFYNLAIHENWFYEPTAKIILKNPLHVHELTNSVERSMLGLFFISVEDKYQVPMRGKYFVPFIQFYLADLIIKENIYTFSTNVNFDSVPALRKVLMNNQIVIDFLRSNLRPEAPKELREFLNDL